jgi:hypothetical protein
VERPTHTSGNLARFLFEQDEELLRAVWGEVFLSILPKGMNMTEGMEWEKTPIISSWGQPDTAYHYIFEDKQWEGKCNTCHKRFLLEVGLRSNTVKRIKPNVEHRRLSMDEPHRSWERTDECDPFFASEHWHAELGPDDIPF